jgi:hypothetical protein
MDMEMVILKCGVCDTAHKAISRVEAETIVRSRLEHENISNGSDIADFEHCDFCGSDASNFVKAEIGWHQSLPCIIWENA